MKKSLLILSIFMLFNFTLSAKNPPPPRTTATTLPPFSLLIFDDILFYDGYAALVTMPAPPAGIIRHRNDLYAKKLTTEQLDSFGPSLTMNVTIEAVCDNYDRIGNVNLAFVPIGATTYTPADVQRIELGRFITPFMNKNIAPTEVPYTFNISNVTAILKDPAVTALYDVWVELEVFGVPYAANEQVAGCAGRNDVFKGTLEFVSETDEIFGINYFLPITFKNELNNYTAAGTDIIGQTIKTINFNLPAPVENAFFHLITSNHGANPGGEEYVRRFHFIYLDDVQVHFYRPGRPTCEPFRIYNTQPNGIYGATPRTNAEWQSFSNWCPGDVITTRIISLGNLAAGSHSFKITVPTAQFVDQQGYIPVSVYLQGALANPLSTSELSKNEVLLYPNPSNNMVEVQSEEKVKSITLLNLLGQVIAKENSNHLDVTSVSKGVYLVQIEFENHAITTKKLVRN